MKLFKRVYLFALQPNKSRIFLHRAQLVQRELPQMFRVRLVRQVQQELRALRARKVIKAPRVDKARLALLVLRDRRGLILLLLVPLAQPAQLGPQAQHLLSPVQLARQEHRVILDLQVRLEQLRL